MIPSSRPLRICLIASSRFPVKEPFAGGLEAHTHALALELQRRGHDVSLFARAGSDPALNLVELPCAIYTPDDASRKDVAAPPELWMAEHHAYLGLMLDLMNGGGRAFDLVHNNSLHHLPVAMSSAVSAPVITTLHTPPVPWLTSAIEFASPNCAFISVSEAMARAWSKIIRSTPVHNGIDLEQWRLGAGGGPAIWAGRIVPEKAPHHAIRAAREAGMTLRLAGEVLDHAYYATEVAPLLGEGVEYMGHLSHTDLIELAREASVAVVTPAWEEPFGLVVAEAMACGTPVAAVARGAMTELVDENSGVLAPPDDVAGLAIAMRRAAALPRAEVRASAERRFSHGVMVDHYEDIYRAAVAGAAR